MNPYYNANLSFRPSATPEGSSDIEHLSKGLHAYINAGNDPELKKQADSIFGKTVDFDGSDVQASLIGRRIASSFGYRHDPLSYIRKNKIATPPNWSGENSQLYTLIGQDFIGKSQEAYNNHKAAKAKAVADAQKDINDSLNLLPEKIVASIESGGGIRSHGSLDPELLQRLTKYNLSETALTSQKRAALAWQYMAPAFESVDALQNPNRDLLLDVAKTLSDEKGELDPYAMSAFLLMTDKKATELQSTNSQFWNNFVDALQNYSYRTIDEVEKQKSQFGGMAYSSWRDAQGVMPERKPEYSDARVEKLYAMMNQAISTAMTPSEKAEWYAKVLSEMGTLVGESAIPMAAGAAAAAATGGGSLLLSAGAGWAGGFAASAPATINQSVAQAYLEGKINPELYGTLAGIGQTAAENVGGVATSLPVAGKLASKLTNYTASRAAGSRILANAYTRTTLNYLTAGAIETATELAEEELGGMIGSSLNTLARSMGVELSEQQYTFGEALGSMKSHEVAAMFGYSYALGLFGIPANYRAARNFAINTDNLLRAGHSPAAVRDIQNKIFEADDRAAEIQSDTSLSLVQKQEKLNALDQELYDYQRKVAEKDIWNIDPEILRKRLEKEGHKLNDQMELALLIEQQVDEQILKEAGMIEAVIEPGQKYRVSFLEPVEKKEDGTESPGKIVTQEWSRNQLTNFLMTSKNEMLFESMRQFQSLLMAHAYAQQANAEQTMTAFQNLGASRPLDVMGALKEKGITPDFLHKAATHAAELRQNLESGGMSAQEAAQQAHPDFEGMTIGEVQTLSSGVSERIETELATSGGKLLALTNDSAVELGAMNIVRRDGSAIFKYVAGHATVNDMLEDNLEIDIKRRVLSGELSKTELESHLRNIEAKLPGNVKLLPKGKDSYSLAELVEAYSKIATGAYLYNAQYLPLNAAEHRLVQSIGRAVDTTRYYKAFGDAYLAFANSQEGKAYLESTGKTFADILTNAGFRIGEQLAKARATAQQRAEVLEARNFEPDIEQEVKALMYQVEQENKLAEINEQEAKEPTIIPADQSITGQEIVIDPVEAVLQKRKKERLQEYYKGSISNYKKYLQQDERDLKNAREAQTRIKKALEKNNFRSEEEKDFVLYTLEHKQELEAELVEDIARYNAQIKQEEAELEKLKNELASTGEEITVEPQQEEPIEEAHVQSTHVEKKPAKTKRKKKAENSLTRLSNASEKIHRGKGTTRDYAIYLRSNVLTEAEAIEKGIAKKSQNGLINPFYSMGQRIAESLTDEEFEIYCNDGYSVKELEDILSTRTKEYYIKEANELTPKTLPKSPKWPKMPQKGVTEQDAYKAVVKSLLSSVSTDKTRYVLNFVYHSIANGVETFAATDGRRLSVVSRTAPIGSKDVIETLDKEGNPIDAGVYPDWRKVIIPSVGNSGTLDLSPYRYAESLTEKKRKVEVGRKFSGGKIYETETYIPQEKWQVEGESHFFLWQHNDKLYRFNPIIIRDAIKLFSSVSKVSNMPSIVSVDVGSDGRMLWRAEHNGWEVKHIAMPMRITNRLGVESLIQAKKGDILLNPTPAEETANFSVKQAQDKGLFKEGLMVADNAVITQPNFSIKAMHVSPHNFRKFSTEFMGSGEGAQSYGWGLYFMTNDLVNLHYFDAFNRGHNANFAARLDEVIFKHFDSISHYDSYLYKNEEQALGELEYYKEEERKKKEILSRSNLSNSDKDFYTDLLKTIQTRINYLHDVIKEKLYLTPATNYRVELNADDTNLLMWDEPVSDAIQDEIDALQKPVDENDWQKTFAEMKALGIKGDNSKRENLSGYQVYNELQRVLGSKKAASEWLASHGYKGIKYLDGNSRSAGEGTYNYVIFSGDDIKITAVNESGVWSMNEGWEPYTDPTANFSIRVAQNPMERFAVDPLGERIVHFVRTEAKRFARVFGDDTPQEQAVNAVQSALAIIQAVDKYLHRQDKPVAQKHRNKLTKLRSIVEKYAQMIESGRTRSFKKISPAEQKELEAAIAELEQEELNSAVTDSEKLIEDDAGMTKKTRLAREREHHRAIVREAAKGRVYSSLAAMLDVAADAMDDYLKDELLKKLERLTATVKIKRTPSKRLKGKMTAPMYRELESAIELMGYSARQREDAIESILDAHETLATAINSGKVNLTGGNALLIELAKNMKAAGIEVNARNLSNELAAYEARVAIFADLDSKNYEQTRTIANAIYQIIRFGRSQWQAKMDEREENIQQYLRYFLARTEAKSGKSNRITQMLEKHKWLDAISLNAAMNAAQTIMALSSYEPIRPIMQTVLTNYATASVARQKHLEEMRKQELYAYGRIIGMHPATEAGYSDKQLKELSDKFDVFYMENNKTIETDIKVEWQEHDADGVLETYSDTLTLTKWEALNYILTYRQDDYKINAVTHGYTDSVLAKLEKFIGSDVMDYGNAMQQMLINDGTIAVYEEREGIPMRNNPLYWPGSININTLSTTREEPLVNPYHPAASHDFLHTRVRNRKEIKGQNAFSIWRRAIADRANYVYADPVTSHLESLLARDQFANRLKTLVGVGLFRQLHATINEIKHAAWQETSLQDVNNTIVATAFSSKALSVLSGNPSSLLKQTSAIANAGLMPGITPEKYLAYVLKVKQGQGHIKIADVMKLDSFTTRKRDNAYVNEMLAMGNDAKFSTLMNWAKAGMSAMDKLDLLANAVSATVVYNHKYDELKALGSMTEEQIKKKCEQQVALYTKLLAQPLSRVDKSALYWQIGNNALGRAVLLMGSEAINKVGMLRANYISARNKGDNPATALTKVLLTMGVTVGLVSSINEAIIAILTGNTPDEDDSIVAWVLATWLNASFGQYLSALPIVGGVTDTFFSPYGGWFSGGIDAPGKRLIENPIKLGQMLTDDEDYSGAQWQKEITRFMRDLTSIAGYAGGAYAPWSIFSTFSAFCHSLTMALNAVYPIAQGASNDAFYSDLLPEWYTDAEGKNTKGRRFKSKIEKWLTPDNNDE